jgi:hypothetical protein
MSSMESKRLTYCWLSLYIGNCISIIVPIDISEDPWDSIYDAVHHFHNLFLVGHLKRFREFFIHDEAEIADQTSRSAENTDLDYADIYFIDLIRKLTNEDTIMPQESELDVTLKG